MDLTALTWILLGIIGAFLRYWAFHSTQYGRSAWGVFTVGDIGLSILFVLLGGIGLVIGIICALGEREGTVVLDLRNKKTKEYDNSYYG